MIIMICDNPFLNEYVSDEVNSLSLFMSSWAFEVLSRPTNHQKEMIIVPALPNITLGLVTCISNRVFIIINVSRICCLLTMSYFAHYYLVT